MKWQYVENNADIHELMNFYNCFHDSCIKELKYISGSYVTEEKMEKMLEVLERELKGVETELEEEVVYDVVNNIIEDRYEKHNVHERMSDKFLGGLTKKTIKGQGNERLLLMWHELSNKF
ncbi:MAG: hypothetical protein ACQEQF_09075 [Bacillota bacterium]